jgi:hypothetical protein
VGKDDERIFAESILTRGLHSGEEMMAAGERLGNRRSAEVTAAVFTEVMERKYSSPPSIDDIVEYSRYLARTYGGDDEAPVKPLVIEGLMRAYEGESGLIEPMELNDIITHQVLISYDLFTSLGLDEKGLDDTVTGALMIVSELS